MPIDERLLKDYGAGSKVLAVGERCHAPDQLPCEERHRAWLWDAHPLSCVLKFPAFLGDTPACRRARALLPGARFVNLLSPAAKAGAWDARLAKFVAPAVHAWAAGKGMRVALLGRRVAVAFLGGDVPLGAIRTVGGVPYLVLPHPSGLCREWNDDTKTKEYRRLALEFCRE